MSATKAALRQMMLARRDLIPPGQMAAAAEAVAQRGLALAHAQAAPGARVGAFWSIRTEIATRPLLERLAKAGYATALPVTQAGGAPLLFRRWSPGDEARRGMLGNAEPLASAEAVTPALVFVPLAAFDRRGTRIGYGGGHYDRTLAALRQATAPHSREIVAVGLAYDVQEVEAVPAEDHDQRLDYVITPTRTLVTGAG